jgi:hypothetical protein
MPVLDHLNLAAFSDYPLQRDPSVFGGLTLRRTWLLDLGLTSGVRSSYRYVTTAVLARINSNGTTVTFDFQAGDVFFRFALPVSSAAGTTIWSEAAASLGGTPDPAMGFGFVQFGDLSAFSTTTGTWTGSAAVEPTLVQALGNHQIFNVRVANEQATIVSDNGPCGSSSSSSSSSGPPPLIVDPTSLAGDVKLAGGYYTTVSLEPQGRTVTFDIVDTAEESEELPCDPIGKLIYPPDYVLPDAPDCRDLVFSLNGIGPEPFTHRFDLQGSLGVTVAPLADSHSLRVDIDQLVLFQPVITEIACPSSSSSTSSSSSATQPFYYTDLADLRLWLNNDPLNGQAGGTVVSTFQDFSGNGFDFTQPVSGRRPTIVNSFSNSRKGLLFDGIDDTLISSFGDPLGDFTIFIVFKNIASAPGGRILDKRYDTGFWVASASGARTVPSPRPSRSGSANRARSAPTSRRRTRQAPCPRT